MNGPPVRDPAARQSRSKEAALVIPLFGLFLLLPPLLSLFEGASTIFGIPVLYVYVFGVWFGLVIAGMWLARRLEAEEQDAIRDTAPAVSPARADGAENG